MSDDLLQPDDTEEMRLRLVNAEKAGYTRGFREGEQYATGALARAEARLGEPKMVRREGDFGVEVVPQWYGVWGRREGYAGHWHRVQGTPNPLQTTRTEADRTAKALNEHAAERTDSLGWRYEVRPYVELQDELNQAMPDAIVG